MRKYERTHPWITFQLDIRKASYKLWMALGEARSKCQHIAGVPLRISTAQKLHQVYLVKGTQATTAIEGNTLSEEEVLQRLEGKLKLGPSKEYLGQEVDNIFKALNRVSSLMMEEGYDLLTVPRIKDFNRMVLEGLKLEEGVIPGEIPFHSVAVGRYSGAPREDCEYLLEQMCSWLNGAEFRRSGEDALVFGLLRAILAHLYLAWIHPFGDGNGRTARLVEFQILLVAGVPTPAAHLLSNFYNQTRMEYYRQLDYASRSGGDVLPFVEYALQGFVDGLKEQLAVIRIQQWDVTWQNYVHSLFQGKESASDVRRRHLILDLSQRETTVPLSEIRRLTSRLAEAYATKTPKTLARDLNELVEMGLVERRPEGFRAKREIILAFLPAHRHADITP